MSHKICVMSHELYMVSVWTIRWVCELYVMSHELYMMSVWTIRWVCELYVMSHVLRDDSQNMRDESRTVHDECVNNNTWKMMSVWTICDHHCEKWWVCDLYVIITSESHECVNYCQLQIGWHSILRLFLKTYTRRTRILMGFIIYYLVLIINPMGRILVRWKSFRNNLEMLCHHTCNWKYVRSWLWKVMSLWTICDHDFGKSWVCELQVIITLTLMMSHELYVMSVWTITRGRWWVCELNVIITLKSDEFVKYMWSFRRKVMSVWTISHHHFDPRDERVEAI